MKTKGSKEGLVVNVENKELNKAYLGYLSSRQRKETILAARGIALNAMAPNLGKPNFDEQVEKTLEQYDDKLKKSNKEIIQSYREFQRIQDKLNPEPYKEIPDSRLNGYKENWGVVGYRYEYANCNFTKFLGTQMFNNGIFGDVEVLHSEAENEKYVKIPIEVREGSGKICAYWGLEITRDILNRNYRLDVYGSINGLTGLALIDDGGSIRANKDISIWVVPRWYGLDLDTMVAPPYPPEEYRVSSSQISPNEYFNNQSSGGVIDNSFDLGREYLGLSLKPDGVFNHSYGSTGDSIFPDYTMRVGDIIIVGSSLELEVNSSVIDIWNTWMSAGIVQRKKIPIMGFVASKPPTIR